MIGPKTYKPLPSEEAAAYRIATHRDNDMCQRCLRYCGPSARDHRKNRSQGGLTTVANLQILGEGCHRWKTENPKAALETGWAVPGYARPEDWPARRWIKTAAWAYNECWVLYDNEGGIHQITEAEAMERMGRDQA